MLEKDLNELDNDFMTLYSKNLLREDFSKDELEKLAELGQVNAVQIYYDLLGENETPNEKIEKVVDGFGENDFNFLFAKAMRLKTEEKYQQYVQLASLYREIYRTYIKIDDEIESAWLSRFGTGKVIGLKEKKRNKKKKMEEIRRQVNEIDFASYVNRSVINCREQFEKTRNFNVLEARYEICSKYRFAEDEYSFADELKTLRKYLIKNFKENKNMVNAFTLARNIKFFGGTEKEENLADKLLTKISQRPYSKTLQNYQLKGKTIKKEEFKEKC